MSRALSLIGIVLTTVYLVTLLLMFGDRLDEVMAMEPNNIGDFLAGVFGPLAILWLILGFFQQGVELRQNTRALELQAEELRNSVEQQKQLVQVNHRQVEAELEVIQFEREQQRVAARPVFVFQGVGGRTSGGRTAYSSTVKNLGNAATDILFSHEPPFSSCSLRKAFSWNRGEDRRIEWEYTDGIADKEVLVTISYVDASGLPGSQAFRFVPNFEKNYNMVEIVRAQADFSDSGRAGHGPAIGTTGIPDHA